jgi:hypothetical protein
MSKVVAKSLKTVLDNPVMQDIQNRNVQIEEHAEKMLEEWSLDLYTRKPGPAVNAHGEFQGTDLDLATFLTALSKRKAVIEIPKYESMRANAKREGERHLAGPRNGGIMSLYSNQEAFSFGVRIKDMSVVQTDPVTGVETHGCPRSFTLVSVEGKWHDGWHRIVFSPSAKENAFLTDNKIWSGNTYVVKNFVHPNRWQSFYGNPYFIAKAMVARLKEEASFLRKEIKRLLDSGIKYPTSGEGAKKEWPETESSGESKPISVKAMEVELDLPERSGEYKPLEMTQAALIKASELYRDWTYSLTPSLNFAVRSVEYAFFTNGFKDEKEKTEEKMPGWITGATWERNYRFPKKRTDWNRLVLFQPAVGEQGVAIRYRNFEKTERVAAE